jgi:hypothetical protein
MARRCLLHNHSKSQLEISTKITNQKWARVRPWTQYPVRREGGREAGRKGLHGKNRGWG